MKKLLALLVFVLLSFDGVTQQKNYSFFINSEKKSISKAELDLLYNEMWRNISNEVGIEKTQERFQWGEAFKVFEKQMSSGSMEISAFGKEFTSMRSGLSLSLEDRGFNPKGKKDLKSHKGINKKENHYKRVSYLYYLGCNYLTNKYN